jgi:hypothetical protein
MIIDMSKIVSFFFFFKKLIFKKTQTNTNLYISFHGSLIVFDILFHLLVSIIDCLCFPIS